MTVALDSNVFIAFLASDDTFYLPAKLILDSIAGGKTQAVCSSIVFGEIVYTARRPESLNIVDDFFKQLPGCTDLPADKAICRKAAELRFAHDGLKLPDAIHLATAIVAKADQFITADKQLANIASKHLTVKTLGNG